MRTQTPLIVGGFALLLCLSTIPAAADGSAQSTPDPYAYTPAPLAVEYDWSGIYIGGHVGGASASWNWDFSNPAERIQNHHTGVFGGGQIGIQKQWNSKLLGVEVSYTSPDVGATSGSAVAAGTRSSDLSDLLMVTGRVGIAYDNILAYVKGGYATADIAFRSANATGLLTTSSSAREDGWVAGLGLEYGIRHNINVGVEYDFVRFNAGTRNQIATPIGIPGSQANGSVDVQAVTARLNFKFGSMADAFVFK
jgi:outer membrane immunogenic protein